MKLENPKKTIESESLKLAKSFFGREVEVTIDRPLGSKHPKHSFQYEVNYGYIAGVIAPDGEELDAYYLGTEESLEKVKGKVIAIVHREDDDDDKLVVVPKGVNLSDEEIAKLIHFQEKNFKSSIIRE
jgi:inorganic pyrophosphatase